MNEEEIRLSQTKIIFDTLAQLISNNETCTYRYLIYDLLGFEKENYTELMSGLEITNALVEKEELKEQNDILKHRLNDIIFDDANDDVELGARFLRKIGYVDFDEERKVYINKHNKEPFWQEDEREKGYYIQDEELDEYTKQLENQLQQKENIIKEVREYIEEKEKNNDNWIDYELLIEPIRIKEILDKE